MRGAEAVEEVDERRLAGERGEVGDGRKVHDLLDGALGEHGETGLAAGHVVGVIAEDVERVGGDGAGRDVEDARQALARDLVHVRDHEQKTLRSRVGGGEGTSAQGAMHGTGGAGLGLHLDHVHGRAEDVLLTLSGPLVDMVGHGAGRRDGIDSRHLGVRVRNVRGGPVAVHRFELAICHIPLSSRTRYIRRRGQADPGLYMRTAPRGAPSATRRRSFP